MDRQNSTGFGEQMADHTRILPVRKVVVAAALVLAGLLIILVVPVAWEGPLLLLNGQPGLRLVDAVGLAVAVPSYLYLNLAVVRLLKKRGV